MRTGYNYAIGYLRAFTVALVVAHHAALAYHPYAPPPPHSLIAQPRWWQAFPVVDSSHWSGAAALVEFNDRFFMSLMFFLSGLFVWEGLRRKHPGGFLRDRLRRLGLPFLLSAAVLAPLAYYPTYLQASAHGLSGGFWQQWLALGQWPAGPAWFVWVLLVFDCLVALLFALSPKVLEIVKRIAGAWGNRPLRCYLLLVLLSALVYLPLALLFTPMHWTAIGPFTFQTSRIVHYFVYFMAGVGVGAAGLPAGLLQADGRLAKRWPLWTLGAVLLFVLVTAIGMATVTAHPTSLPWIAAADLGFVFSCAASVFAFLALFTRFVKSGSAWCDSFSANSYGIYLVHYVFVSWLLLAMVPVALPAFAKFVLVAAAALLLSWLVAAVLRRLPAIRSVV